MTGLSDLTEACLAANGRSRHRLALGEARAAVTGEIADMPGFVLALSEWLGSDPEAVFRDKWVRDESAP